MFFALVFSVSSSFAYRNWAYIELDDVWNYACYDNGGTCLPTVIVYPQK